MTFEEFFKKKRIDLVALELGGQTLFSEFKMHFEQMGEKSFDHTKKYWFNKLRRQYPLAPEVKTEKAHIANPLAEQTVTESLLETMATAPLPKLGFVPKFKAGSSPKPLAVAEDKKEDISNQATNQITAESLPEIEAPAPSPKLGFVPKFKAANMARPAAAAEDKKDEAINPPSVQPAAENSQEVIAPAPSPKLGFVPKFRAGITPKPAANAEDKPDAVSTQAVEEINTEPKAVPDIPTPSAEATEAKPAYKPRFNMKNLPPKAGG